MTCTHLQRLEAVDPTSHRGCEECLATGRRWVHLRPARQEPSFGHPSAGR